MNPNLVQQELRIYSGDRLYYTCLIGPLLNNSPPVAFSAQGVIVDGVRIDNPRVEWVDLDVKLPDVSAFFASKKDSKSVVDKRALYLHVDGKFWMFRKKKGISPDAWIPLQHGHSMGDFVGVIPVASPVGKGNKGEAVEEEELNKPNEAGIYWFKPSGMDRVHPVQVIEMNNGDLEALSFGTLETIKVSETLDSQWFGKIHCQKVDTV